MGPIFTPPIVRGENDKLATFVVPGAGGGANFPGASVDPETGILYIPSATRPHGMSLIAPPEGTSDWPFVIQMERQVGPFGLPLLKPPYRRITAIDLNTGNHVWQIPFGMGPANHPMLEHLDLPNESKTSTPRAIQSRERRRSAVRAKVNATPVSAQATSFGIGVRGRHGASSRQLATAAQLLRSKEASFLGKTIFHPLPILIGIMTEQRTY